MWRVWKKGKVHTEFWWGNLRKRDLLEDLRVDGRVILKRIFKEQDGDDEDWINMAHSERVLGFFEHGNEPSGSIK